MYMYIYYMIYVCMCVCMYACIYYVLVIMNTNDCVDWNIMSWQPPVHKYSGE